MNNKDKNFISAVIYIHNCRNAISDFLEQIWNAINTYFEKFEIICVNDASDDNSIDVIKKFSESHHGGVLSIVNMSYYQGMEASMNAGVDLAIGDFVYEFDSTARDYDIELILKIYEYSLEGYDIVSASNHISRLSSALFYSLFNRSANIQYKLNTESFRILSRRAINRIHSMSRTIPYRKALYANCGLKTDTLYYASNGSVKHNRTKEYKLQRYNTALNSLILFTDIAYKMALLMTTVMMAATMAGIIYTLVVYILKKPVAGYTTIMLLTSGAFFGVFAILAVIIKYLSVLVDMVFKEQKYIIESIEKF